MALNWLTALLVYTLLLKKKKKKAGFDYTMNGLFQRHSPHFTQEKPCIRFSPNKTNVTFCSPSSVHTPGVCRANEKGSPWQLERKETGNQIEVDVLLTASS